MTSTPTPEQTARAAELAPRVAAITGLGHTYGFPSEGVHLMEESWPLLMVGNRRWRPLDPRAFQAVLLALPQTTARRVMCRVRWPDGVTRDDLAIGLWLWTPTGMLAFYEALVEVSINFSIKPIALSS